MILLLRSELAHATSTTFLMLRSELAHVTSSTLLVLRSELGHVTSTMLLMLCPHFFMYTVNPQNEKEKGQFFFENQVLCVNLKRLAGPSK